MKNRNQKSQGRKKHELDFGNLNVDTINDERIYMEGILNERFNFFIIVFSLILGGAAATNRDDMIPIILGFGFLVCLLLWIVIWRAYRKQRLLFAALEGKCKDHAAVWANEQANRRIVNLRSVVWMMGWLIPCLCWLLLLVLFVVSIKDWLTTVLGNL